MVCKHKLEFADDVASCLECNRKFNYKDCSRCNRKKIIYCKELCKSCYNLKLRNVEKHKEAMKKWRDKNPEYFKGYYRRKKDVEK